MVGIDLYKSWPSVRRRSADAGVAKGMTTLDAPLAREVARRVDPGRMSLLLSQLVEVIGGRGLASIFGFDTNPSPAYGRLVGLNLKENQFASFLDGFVAAVSQLGLTGPVPAARARRHESATDDRCRAALPSPMGVTARTRKDTPRAVTRFDEFAALMVNEPSLAAALDAGMADGLPPGLLESTNALLGAIAAAVRMNDAGAIRRIGGDFGSLAAALYEATRGVGAERGATRRGRSRLTARTNTAGLDGPVLIRKAPRTSRALIHMIQIDGEDVPVDDAMIDPRTKKWVRRRKKKG